MEPIFAPAKVNLCLYVGQTRPRDGRHELATVFDALDLADRLTLESGPSILTDEVICPGVDGPNLVSDALALLREAGWSGPPQRVSIAKRIPVAAGMGGGSSDAAALLAHLGDGLDPAHLANRLGADVAALLTPGVWFGTGAGDDLVTVEAELDPRAYVVVPAPVGLSTAAVYREADRLGLARDPAELDRLSGRAYRGLSAGGRFPTELIVNDLEPAAVSLYPEISGTLEAVRSTGAAEAIVSGSGPTCVGIWWGTDCVAAAETAARTLAERFPGAQVAVPWASPSQSLASP